MIINIYSRLLASSWIELPRCYIGKDGASFQALMCDIGLVIKRILVRCPVTKKLNVTGVVIEEDAFVATDLKPGTVACSHCGETHSWNKKEVILAR